jgi:tetratricopeptide (TPR) repeat protein
MESRFWMGPLQIFMYKPRLATACIIVLMVLVPTMLPGQNLEHHMRLGYSADSAGQYDEAIHQYGRAIQLMPNYAKAYYNRAVVRQKRSEHSLALVDLNNCIRLDSSMADAYFNRAVANYHTGNMLFAAADAEEFIKRGKPEFDDWLAISFIREENQDYKNSAGALENYLKTETNDLIQLMRLGKLLVNAGEVSAAETHYSRLIERFPDASIIYQSRAEARYEGQLYSGALDDYNMCILQGKRDAQVYKCRADVHLALGNENSALEDYTAAIYRDTANANYYLDRGVLYLKLGSYSAAESDLNAAIRKKCGDLRYCYMARGLARYNLNKGREACEDWERSAILGQQEGKTYLEKYCRRAEPHE